MSKYRITLEGKTYEMELELIAESAFSQPTEKKEYKKFSSTANDPTVRVIDPSAEKKITNNNGSVTAPMPGTIIKIVKSEGDAVKSGEVVLILEAMKMENEILAPIDGNITKTYCTAGSTVASGEILFEIQ